MSWYENLQPASFRGLVFDVLKTSESVTRDQAVYMYPNVDGGDVKDLGRKPRPFRMTAFLWGDEYEYQLQSLISCLDMPGSGELVHPIYGSVPAVVVTGYDVRHDAENPNSCTIELSFLEDKTGTALFAQQLPEQFGSDILDRLDVMVAELGDFFDAIMHTLYGVQMLIKRVATIESTLINTLLIFKDDVAHTAQDVEWLIESPKYFVRELSHVLDVHTSSVASSIPALGSSAPATTVGLTAAATPEVAPASAVMSSWAAVEDDMDTLNTLPESLVNGDTAPEVPLPSGATQADVQDVKAVYMVLSVGELISTATALLSDADQAEVLTPADIEQMVDDVRTRVQAAIDFLRTRYQPAQTLVTATKEPVGILWQSIVNSLKALALQVQDLAVLLLSQRPPLTRKHVKNDSCFLLLAHEWYGDHQRAAELHRLNPDIINPNRITTGMVINAYAK